MSYCRVTPQGRVLMPRQIVGRRDMRRGPVPNTVTLSNYQAGQLGFSLKPPKWIRKAQPGKFIVKHALPIAAVGAAFLIPGAAAFAAKGLVGAGRLAVTGAGRLVTGAGKLAKSGAQGFAKVFRHPPKPPSTGGIATTMPVPVLRDVPVASPTLGPTDMVPVSAPTLAQVGGGGGGGNGSGDTDLIGPPAPASSAGPSGPMLAGLAVGGLLLLMSARKPARRQSYR